MGLTISKSKVLTAEEKPCSCTLCTEMTPEEVLQQAHMMANWIADTENSDPEYRDMQLEIENLEEENDLLGEYIDELKGEIERLKGR